MDPAIIDQWLQRKPRAVSVAIAARAALRTLPILTLGASVEHRARQSKSVLAVFRSLNVAWVAAAASTQQAELRKAAREALDGLDPDLGFIGQLILENAAGAAFAAAASASGSASYGARVISIHSEVASHYERMRFFDKVGNTGGKVMAAIATGLAVDLPGASGRRTDVFYDEAITLDMTGIDQGLPPRDLAVAPLWMHGNPPFATESWARLKTSLEALEEDWGVWTSWYEARLRGDPLIPDSDVTRALIAKDVWQGSPDVVNRTIRQVSGKQTVSIPSQEVASIQPVWQEGRLTNSTQAIDTNIGDANFRAALAALRIELKEFIGDLQSEENIDPRFLAFVRKVEANMPADSPSSTELFRIGHSEEILARYAGTVDREWPEFLASRYHAIALQFDRTMKQSNLWREFKRNARAAKMSPGQAASAGVLASEVAKTLTDESSREFVDESIPASLLRLSDVSEAIGAIGVEQLPGNPIHGGKLIALDLMESVNNVFKRLAEAIVLAKDALDDGVRKGSAVARTTLKNYGTGFASGVTKSASSVGRKDGERAIRYFRNLVIGGTGAASAFLIHRLVKAFPEIFGWLERFVANLLL